MFWKTMTILWTVLLLILTGAAVQFVRTAQPGSSKVEVSLKGTQATTQPCSSKVEVSPKGPAKSTQATAILSNVRYKEMALMPALRNPKKINIIMGKSDVSLLPKDLRHRLSVRRLKGDMLAIDVCGCKSDLQARRLAYAVAESYIQFVRELETEVSKVTIKRLTDRRDSLRNQRDLVCKQITSIRRKTPSAMVQGQRNLSLIRLENITRELVEARSEMTQAESALEVHKEMRKKNSLADSPEVRMALETDSILQGLKFLLIEVKAGLQTLPPNRDKKSAITVLEGEIKARQKEILKNQTETIGLQVWMSNEIACKRAVDLMERKAIAGAEASDLVRVLSMIDSRESEKKDLDEMLIKIEHRLLEVKMRLSEGMPELIGILP